ncbi:uncharacterized protein L199_000543 [Kwoniella botswanensis]|uniref:uncharacterized protein n=1 Tax=Kwoniella botswanensis TaxID=1268659 RepID=UPI00315D93EE
MSQDNNDWTSFADQEEFDASIHALWDQSGTQSSGNGKGYDFGDSACSRVTIEDYEQLEKEKAERIAMNKLIAESDQYTFDEAYQENDSGSTN